MKADIDALVALAQTSGLTTYYVDVPVAPTYPYLLIWSGSGGLPLERPVSDSHADIDEAVGVTAVAGTPGGVLIVQERARAVLDLKSPVVTGRVTSLELIESRPVQMDRDVIATSTNRNPAYGVDMYRYRSTPA